MLTLKQQDHVWAQWRTGQSVRSIARDMGAEPQHLRRYFAATGGVRTHSASRSVRQLSLAEREEISRGLAAGHSQRRIAIVLGRPHSTISREVAATAAATPTEPTTPTAAFCQP